MLKNCILPINYDTNYNECCGEIICHSVEQFSITCKLCKLILFEFGEFLEHYKDLHLNELRESFVEGKKKETETDDDTEILRCFKPLDLKNMKDEIVEFSDINNSIEKNVEEVIFKQENSWPDSDHENISDGSDKSKEKYKPDLVQDSDDEDKPLRILPKSAEEKLRKVSCDQCNKKFTSDKRLHIHVKLTHLREKPYTCNYCPQSFAEERWLQAHILTHTGYVCSYCQKSFKTKKGLKYHQPIHLDQKKEFMCPYENCDRGFTNAWSLKNHMVYHGTKRYVCEECGHSFYKEASFIVHKRGHTGEKPFACKQCKSRFASKSLLCEHMGSHAPERRHVCDVCGKSFNRHKALYHHKHLHLGVKKFVCKICGAAYAQAAGLSAHTRKHKQNVLGISQSEDLDTSWSEIFHNKNVRF